MPLHVEITPIPCRVDASFLYRDEARQDTVDGEVIGISSYKGSVPTFTVLLSNGAMFSYVPPSVVRKAKAYGERVAVDRDTFVIRTCREEEVCIYDDYKHFVKIHTKKHGGPTFHAFGLKDLCYNDCPSENMTVVAFNAVASQPVTAYIKNCMLFISGTYKLTLDWGDANVLLHLIELENGQLAFLPSHKVLFNGNPHDLKELPGYRAVHDTFSVEGQNA